MTLEEWIKGYRDKIHAPDDLVIFDEISGCFQAGFLRSAYIMSWIGIAENLKAKILQSANLGDKQSENSLKTVEEAESKKLSVDKIILDEVVKLNLIDSSEQSALIFLWQRRCLFAHPYNMAPNEDELKHAVMHLVDICLSKPLLFKKNYLEELVKNLATKPYFLTGDVEKIEQYFMSIMPRITSNLHPFLFKSLLFELGNIIDDTSKDDIKRKLKIFLIVLLRESDLPLSDDSWTLEHKAINFPYTVLYGCAQIKTWSKFPQRVKEVLVDYAVAEKDNTKIWNIKYIFFHLVNKGQFDEIFKAKYFTMLDAISFSYAISFYGDSKKSYERLVEELDSGNFDKQNAVIHFLKEEKGKVFVTQLETHQLLNLGSSLLYCAKNGCWLGDEYIKSLALHGTEQNIASGILTSTIFNRSNGFLINLEYFKIAINIIEKLPAVVGEKMIKDLEELINTTVDSYHHISDENLDFAKKEISNTKSPLSNLSDGILDSLKKFKYKFEGIDL